jgi:hypothetical protein
MRPGRPGRRAEVVDVHLDVSWLVPADLGAIDALARLQVSATHCGRSLRLHGARGGLPELLEFMGLVDVLRLCRCCDPCPGDPTAVMPR